MTFKHKLSARLARMWHPVVGALVALMVVVACELPLARGSGGDEVSRLEVFPQAATVYPNDTTELMAVAFTAASDTANTDVTWSVTGGNVISTRRNGGRHYGKYKAGSQTGNYKVVAQTTSGTVADTATVAVTPIPVATVTVTPAVVSVLVGASVQLAAVTADSAGGPLSGRQVTWTSRAPSVADVNSAGLVTGAAVGSTRIIATSEGKSDSSVVTVTTVAAPVASVSVTPGSPGILVGQTVQLTATPRDSNGSALGGRTVTWASSNPTVAAVNSTGLVAGAAVGSATITATSEGQSGTASITVVAAPVPVASVDVTPTSAGVYVGDVVQLTATPKDAGGNPLTGRTVTWASSNTTVATVNGSGLVTGRAVGSATITATSEGQSGTSAITVVPVPVASVAVTPATANVPVGATFQLTATPSDSNGNPLTGRTVTWASSNTTVATVNGSGLVTGRAGGSATIRATSEGQSDSAAVTVTSVPVASVTVSPASANLVAGQTVQLAATTRDASGNTLTGRTVTWSSSDPTVAVVYQSGLVTGIALGTATITATSEGQSGSATVTVTTGPPPVIVNGCPASGYLRLVNVSTQSELTSALGAAQPGDQIRIAAGIYGGASMSRSGTSTNPIVICSNASGGAILKGGFKNTGNYLMIAGLVFEGPSGVNQVILSDCHHVTFMRNEVRFGNSKAGLAVHLTHEVTITYNYIHNNGVDTGIDHGIYYSGTLASDGGAPRLSITPPSVIANNLIVQNAARGISFHYNNAGTNEGVFDVLVAHNTIVLNGSTGILMSDGDRRTVVNNIVAFNGTAGGEEQIRVFVRPPGGQGLDIPAVGDKVWNNVTWDTQPADAGIFNNTPSEVSGNVIGNPLFVTQFTNLHIQAGSPAIGLGRVGYPTVDYDGKTRALPPAAGAYEFVP